MITTGKLNHQSKAELAAIAKSLKIQATGLNKEQLVQAISKATRVKSAPSKPQAKAPPKAQAASSLKSSPKPKSGTAKSKNSAQQPRVTQPKVTQPKKVAATTASAKALVKKSAIAQTPSKQPAAKQTAAKQPAAKQPTAKKTPAKPVASKKDQEKQAPEKQSGEKQAAVRQAPVKTLSKPASPSKAVGAKAVGVSAGSAEKPPEEKSTTNPKILKKIREMQLQKEASKDIGFKPRLIQPPGASDPIFDKEPQKDRVALFVRDPYWLQVSWDITRNAIERSQAALAEQWYGARPVLRLIRIEDSQATSVSETLQAEIEIRGGVRNWYIPWTGESCSFRVSVGYAGSGGRFHVIAQSNIVRTPAANSSDAIDQHWTDLGAEGEKIFALSGGYDNERETGELQEMLEERLNRSLGAPTLAKLGAAADGIHARRGGFHFDMDVELVVYGCTSPDAYLTVNEEPVALRSDGSFVVRLPFPDRRQVIPAVAVARDGSHQRTIVVGVERNTKVMEPLEQEQDLGD